MLQIRSSVTYVYFFKHAFCHTCNILRNTTYRRHSYPWRKMTAIARLFSVGVLQVFLATSCVTLQWRAVVRSKHVLFTYINTAAICIDDIKIDIFYIHRIIGYILQVYWKFGLSIITVKCFLWRSMQVSRITFAQGHFIPLFGTKNNYVFSVALQL